MDDFLQGVKRLSNVDGVLKEAQDVSTPSKEIDVGEVLKPESGTAMENATVQTIYEGNILKKIIVHCDCGKELVITCEKS